MQDNNTISCNDFKRLWDSVGKNEDYPLKVTGNSMYPFLVNEKSTVYIRKPDDISFQRGQILLFFRPDGSYILHRVFRVLDDGRLLMNGDSQIWLEIIPTNAVCAVVTKIKRTNQIIPVGSIEYRILIKLWMATFPCRKVFIKLGHWGRIVSKRLFR